MNKLPSETYILSLLEDIKMYVENVTIVQKRPVGILQLWIVRGAGSGSCPLLKKKNAERKYSLFVVWSAASWLQGWWAFFNFFPEIFHHFLWL